MARTRETMARTTESTLVARYPGTRPVKLNLNLTRVRVLIRALEPVVDMLLDAPGSTPELARQWLEAKTMLKELRFLKDQKF